MKLSTKGRYRLCAMVVWMNACLNEVVDSITLEDLVNQYRKMKDIHRSIQNI